MSTWRWTTKWALGASAILTFVVYLMAYSAALENGTIAPQGQIVFTMLFWWAFIKWSLDAAVWIWTLARRFR